MKIIVYSTQQCPWCNKLKEWLKENKISFEEKDVGKDEKAAKEMIKKFGQISVPITEIDDKYVLGFDIASLKKLLKIK